MEMNGHTLDAHYGHQNYLIIHSFNFSLLSIENSIILFFGLKISISFKPCDLIAILIIVEAL